MRTRGVRPVFVLVGVVAVATVTGIYACNAAAEKKRASGFVSGTGRIEASEIAVATNVPGRIDRILVQEGQSVRAGQVVARMQVQSLVAERTEADARYKHALYLAVSADADVLLRETQTQAAEVAVQHYESEFQAIVQRLSSAVAMPGTGSGAVQELEDLRAEARRVAAVAAAADAQLAAARMAVVAARLDAESAHAGVEAAEATIRRVETALADAALTSPRDAEVQSRAAQPGDVVQAGSPVLNLVDSTNVRMTFALPEAGVDGVRVGDEARIVLETLPESVIRATISNVESAAPTLLRHNIPDERVRPMCRLTAQLDRAFIHRYLKQVKAGASGVVWLRLDPALPWPSTLNVGEP
jgi:HlyD family secretion protein